MRITAVTLKQFRCFDTQSVSFSKPLVLIEGPNGSGKTSILEALHYACHLRSFRTRTTRELVHFGNEAFHVDVSVELDAPLENEKNSIAIGYSPAKRSVKVNAAALTSYKDLVTIYRTITITDEDLQLIKGSPETRRSFMDSAISLTHPGYPKMLRIYTHILEQRNALLASQASKSLNMESYTIWTEQLSVAAQSIREHRLQLLKEIRVRVTELLKTYFDSPLDVRLEYRPRELTPHIERNERVARHTLFGAHLDDLAILISDKASKAFASRGQQKLIALLLKLAQPATLNPASCVFLLDDVLADLDEDRLTRLFKLLSSFNTQVIVTSPVAHPLLHSVVSPYDHERIKLTD